MENEDIFDRLKVHRKELSISNASISVEDVDKIIDAARWAPSPFNSQPWEFLSIEDTSLRGYIKGLFSEKESESFDRAYKSISFFPTSIAVLYDKTRMDPGKNAEQMGILCMGTCLGNLFLRAAELSIKMENISFTSEMREERKKIEKKLGLPQNIRLISIVGMGYTKTTGHSIETSYEVFNNYLTKHIHLDNFKNRFECDPYVPSPIKNGVLELVKPRKSYRKHYLPKEIDKEHELQIIKASLNSHCFLKKSKPPWRLLIIKDDQIRGSLARRIRSCAYDAYMDEKYFQKMKGWMRFSEKEMRDKKDGVFAYIMYKYMGVFVKAAMTIIDLPAMGLVKKAVIPIFSKAFFYDLVKASPMLLTIIHEPESEEQDSEEHEAEHLAIGMAIQSILLSCWSLKMGVQFLSILFNDKESEKEIQRELGIPEKFAIVDMIRIGYINPKAVPPQYFNVQGNVRRPCSEIIHKNSYGKRSSIL